MKYCIWTTLQFVSNVKKNIKAMRSAFAHHVRVLTARVAVRIIVFKSTLTRNSAKNVLVRRRERDRNQLSIDEILTLMQKSQNGLTKKSFHSPMKTYKWKDPRTQIMICNDCAKRKYLERSPRIWIREGRCSFCLDRTYVCQIIEYVMVINDDVH